MKYHFPQILSNLAFGDRRFAFECRASSAQQLTRGFYAALNDLHPEKAYVVCPIEGSYSLSKDIRVSGLVECVEMLRQDVKDQRWIGSLDKI